MTPRPVQDCPKYDDAAKTKLHLTCAESACFTKKGVPIRDMTKGVSIDMCV